MPDDPSKRGRADRSRVSQQPHEVGHLAKKHDLPKPLVQKVIEQVGLSRKRVDDYLEKMKRSGR